MYKLKKKNLILGIPLAVFSIEAYLGMIIGYFAAHFVSPRIKLNTFQLGKYKLHLHHWLLGLSFLPLVFTYKFFPFSLPFTSGFLGGIIIQGLFCYPDWHKVLIKQKKHES